MGADFIFATAPVDTLDNYLAKLQWLTYKLSVDDIDLMITDLGLDPSDGPVGTLTNEVIRAHRWMSTNPRDAGIINLGSGPHWITGGVTWGDNPTDSFQEICVLGLIDGSYDYYQSLEKPVDNDGAGR